MIKKQHYLKVDLVNCCDSVLPKNLKKKMEDFVNFISKINLAKGYRNRELESFTEKNKDKLTLNNYARIYGFLLYMEI